MAMLVSGSVANRFVAVTFLDVSTWHQPFHFMAPITDRIGLG